jgi:hypothetical protein
MQPRIGEMMLDRGLISVEDLDRALQDQRGTGRRIGEALVERHCCVESARRLPVWGGV